MNIGEYQEAMRHVCTTPEEMQSFRTALMGLLEAHGAMVEHARQYLKQRPPFDLVSFQKEIGGLLWYLSQLCGTLGIVFADELQKHMQNHPSATPFRIKRRRDPV